MNASKLPIATQCNKAALAETIDMADPLISLGSWEIVPFSDALHKTRIERADGFDRLSCRANVQRVCFALMSGH
jgi:hypothetical protein